MCKPVPAKPVLEGNNYMRLLTKLLAALAVLALLATACGSDDEVVAVIDHMMRTRRVVSGREKQTLLG